MTDETTTTNTEATEETQNTATPEAKNEKTQERSNDRNRRGRGGRGRRDRGERQPKEFEESIIQIDRVTRVTKGGRQLRFRVSVVIGDQKGRVGFGTGKSAEVMVGVQKAIAKAKANLVTVPVFEDTIPHAVTKKFKATKVTLLPAPEGKGVIAGGAARKVLELAGIKNVLSKIHGSRNNLNVAYTTVAALKELQNRAPHKPKAAEEDAKEEVKAEEKPKKAPAKKTTKKSDK